MSDQGQGRSYCRDDETVVDRDGLPHYTGLNPDLLKEYKNRVNLALARLEGSGSDEENSLEKKQIRFRVELLDELHGRAWKRTEHLAANPKELKRENGEQLIFDALASLNNEAIVKKGMAFDSFFKRSYRKRGTDMGEYLANKEKLWEDLQERDSATRLSDDLMAYFLLDGAGLSEDQKRRIVMNSGSECKLEAFQHALRVNLYDVHEKERRNPQRRHQHRQISQKWNKGHRGKANQVEDHEESDISDEEFDEEEQANAVDEADDNSDAGASNDDEVYEACSAYEAARKKLKDTQKQGGFFKGEVAFEERQEAIKEEKKRTRCGACGRIGHWAGDKDCPKSGQQGAKKFGGGKGGKPKGKAKPGKSKRAFFTLDEDDVDYDMGDVYAGAVAANGEPDQGDSDSFQGGSSDDEPKDEREDDGYHNRNYDGDRKGSQGAAAAAAQEEFIPTEIFGEWKAYELKKRLNELNLHVSGTREILIERLVGYYAGIAQVKKGCSTSKTAGALCSGTSVGLRGENMKCADCGKCGHHGGDMKVYKQIQERREQIKLELDSKPITKPKMKGSSASSAASSTTATWEFIDHANELTCPVCYRMNGNKFYGCPNYLAIMKCKGTYDYELGELPGSRTEAPILETPLEFAGEQLDKRELILFNAGDEHSFNDQLGKSEAAFVVANDSAFRSVDFDAVALGDAACALCMHSKHWGQHFERVLPPGLACRPTGNYWLFTFASGAKQKGEVWIIPIGIGGYRGEAHSTEIPAEQTPLLLSMPALEMLDGHIHMQTKKLELTALGITVALVKMGKTPHLGIDVSQFGDDESAGAQKMDLTSTRGDALVHYANDLEVMKQGYAFLETGCHGDGFDVSLNSDGATVDLNDPRAQCGFGKTDVDSGKPIQKPSGYLTNSQCILNKLAMPCKCKGPHGMVEGGWITMQKERSDKVMEIFNNFADFLTPLTLLGPSVDERAAQIGKLEETNATVKLLMIRRSPRALLAVQPHLHASQAPLRTAYARSERGMWQELGWEDWASLSPQQRAMKIAGADVLIMVYGAQIGEAEGEEKDEETTRQQRWDQLPRELKMAIRRLHENLGHASKVEMLRALRISRASEAAIKDADQAESQFLNVICLGRSFQVVALLGEIREMASSSTILETYELCWASWAGEPEVGIIVDRAESFLGSFSENIANRGCRFDPAAKAAAWRIAKVERHGKLHYGKQHEKHMRGWRVRTPSSGQNFDKYDQSEASDEEVRAWPVSAQDADLIDATGTYDGGQCHLTFVKTEFLYSQSRRRRGHLQRHRRQRCRSRVRGKKFQHHSQKQQSNKRYHNHFDRTDHLCLKSQQFDNENSGTSRKRRFNRKKFQWEKIGIQIYTTIIQYLYAEVKARSADEAGQREAKRQWLLDDVPHSIRESRKDQEAAFNVYDDSDHMLEAAYVTYEVNRTFYEERGISKELLGFGVERNDFEYACQVGQTTAKKGRKEPRSMELNEEQRRMFTGPGGSDEKEWKSWQDLDACETLNVAESERIWGNKSEGTVEGRFEAKSRMVVQGFKDKSPG
ncbi:unnamed protein product [Prorocentrum cordatum]|uniref:SAP domain-containing protein n=1 Tax=Prorocentrum cordatum TaxID=2364126 RepID=A0ABN9X135_9DINO|nr:unnamed protein product [Polarella glacialis]